MAGIFGRHARLLRAVVLISGAHPEVYRRGAEYSRELAELFCTVLLRHRDEIHRPDPETAVHAAVNTVFAALVVRTAYGPQFSIALSDVQFLTELTAMVRRYLDS